MRAAAKPSVVALPGSTFAMNFRHSIRLAAFALAAVAAGAQAQPRFKIYDVG